MFALSLLLQTPLPSVCLSPLPYAHLFWILLLGMPASNHYHFFVDIVPCAALLQLSRDKINGHIHQHPKTLQYTLPYTISLIISGPVI